MQPQYSRIPRERPSSGIFGDWGQLRALRSQRASTPRSRLDHGRKRVAILADTPNIFRSIQRTYGLSERPDYRQLYRQGEGLGRISDAIAFVNDGVACRFAEALERLGFSVSRSEAHDVDDHLTARAVALHGRVERVLLCSGDGDYLPLVVLLQARGTEVIVCAVANNCSRRLRQQADRFLHMPTIDRTTREAVSITRLNRQRNGGAET